MQPHFADAGNDTVYGTTMTLAALRGYLDSQGVDSRAWWLNVQSAIVQVTAAARGVLAHCSQQAHCSEFSCLLLLSLITYLAGACSNP